MFPVGDDNSQRRTTPVVTFVLIGLNVLVFLAELSGGDQFITNWAFVPARFSEDPGANAVTLFSAMFMHGGWAHLGGNVLYLWIFGDNVEDAMGHFKFLMFYLLCGILATGAHILAAQAAGGLNLVIPSLGASGAIAGVLGGYLVLFPRKTVRVLFFIFPVAMPALVVIGFWIVTQIFSGVGSVARTQQTGETGGIAYFAHIGGAVAGLILVWLFRNPQVQQRAAERYNFGNPYGPRDF